MSDKRAKADKYRDLAIAMDPHKDFKGIIENSMAAMRLYQEIGEHVQYIKMLNLLGISYSAVGRSPKAMDCYLDGLEYINNYHIKGLAHIFYTNIGTRYQELGDWDKALSYFQLAKEDMQFCDFNNGYSKNTWKVVIELNLALVYTYMADYNRADASITAAQELNQTCDSSIYEFSLAIIEAKLRYAQGKTQYVEERVPELIRHMDEEGQDVIIGDRYEDVRDLVELLKMIQDTKNWKAVLQKFENYTDQNGVLAFRIYASEFWCEYYKYIQDDKMYDESCMKYAELAEEQERDMNVERAGALKLMLELDEAQMVYKSEKKTSECDVLTGLGNRFAMRDDFERVISAKEDLGTMIAIGLLDLDNLKKLNDTYGHLAGDEALKAVADLIFNCTDGFGRAYRFGGDEFLIMVPNASKKVMKRIAQKVQDKLEISSIQNAGTATGYLTISQAYCIDQITKDISVEKLAEAADAVLYQIKSSGKNDYRIETLYRK